jgi:hypothetical protein
LFLYYIFFVVGKTRFITTRTNIIYFIMNIPSAQNLCGTTKPALNLNDSERFSVSPAFLTLPSLETHEGLFFHEVPQSTLFSMLPFSWFSLMSSLVLLTALSSEIVVF